MTDVLTVSDRRVDFRLHEAVIHAVKGVSFRVPANRTVALVGESGSGKSVVSQTILRILPSTATICGGSVTFRDPQNPGFETEITSLDADGSQMRAIRGSNISIIFEEPMISLSPLHTVGDQVSEALRLHHNVSKPEGMELTTDLLRLVGFPNPAND